MPAKRRMKSSPARRARNAGRIGNGGPPGVPPSACYHLKRLYLVASGGIPSGTPLLGALGLTATSMPTALRTFLASWDLIRINSVRVRFVPRFNVNNYIIGGAGEIPQLVTVVNYDDFTTPTSVDFVLGQAASKMVMFDREVSIVCHPRPLTTAVTASGTPPYSAVLPGGGWLNSNYFTAGTTGILPMLKYAVSTVTSPAGSGVIDIYFDLDATLAQSVTG